MRREKLSVCVGRSLLFEAYVCVLGYDLGKKIYLKNYTQIILQRDFARTAEVMLLGCCNSGSVLQVMFLLLFLLLV